MNEDTLLTLTANMRVWEEMRIQPEGISLRQISDEQPVLLVFLRHFGCSFCREALQDIATQRASLEAKGVRLVLVHMAPKRATAERFFKKYNLFPITHVSDPDKRFYQAFGLTRATPNQIFGLMSWIRGFEVGIVRGHGFDNPNAEIGDGFQMPGVFVIYQGEIKRSYIHARAWDRPNYEDLVGCCIP